MTVRAKFKCTQITRQESSKLVKGDDGKATYVSCEVHTIHATPVYGNDDPAHENTKFWNASPGGKLELNCVNPEAVAQFDVGREFYVDFIPILPQT